MYVTNFVSFVNFEKIDLLLIQYKVNDRFYIEPFPFGGHLLCSVPPEIFVLAV